MIKIIAARLTEENEGPVNGFSPVFATQVVATPEFERSDAGANGPQQERRKMRVIGRFRG
jgi:hypothetical protein